MIIRLIQFAIELTLKLPTRTKLGNRQQPPDNKLVDVLVALHKTDVPEVDNREKQGKKKQRK